MRLGSRRRRPDRRRHGGPSSLDHAGSISTAGAFSSAWTSTSRSRTASCATTPASSRRCPTILLARERGARVVLASHLGKAKGTPDPKYSLAPVARTLEHRLGAPVAFAPDCVGPEAEAAARALAPGEVLLLENLRFHPGEEANDAAFAKQLAALGDVYVNDAFGTAHRAHASTAGMAAFFPRRPRGIGLLMEKELKALARVATDIEHPFAAILGGAKILGKIAALKSARREGRRRPRRGRDGEPLRRRARSPRGPVAPRAGRRPDRAADSRPVQGARASRSSCRRTSSSRRRSRRRPRRRRSR